MTSPRSDALRPGRVVGGCKVPSQRPGEPPKATRGEPGAVLRVLAIDPGSKTGWAYFDGRSVTFGTWNLTPDRWASLGSRVLRLKAELRAVFALGVDLVVFEEVRRHLGTDAAHVYGAVVGAVQAEALAAGVPFEAVPVGVVKKHWTGRGDANKAAMIEAARSRGFTPEDDNQADALALLDFARHEYQGGLS